LVKKKEKSTTRSQKYKIVQSKVNHPIDN